jgi:hypothetical protein
MPGTYLGRNCRSPLGAAESSQQNEAGSHSGSQWALVCSFAQYMAMQIETIMPIIGAAFVF